MAVCQVRSIITTVQSAQCYADVSLQKSQALELNNLRQEEYFSQGKASSCLSATMVKSNEPEDTATSELRTSTSSGPSQTHELELSISDAHALELTGAPGSSVDAQVINLQASLGRSADVIEEGSISSAESGELSLVGRPMKRIRSNALVFNPDGNETGLENEHLQFKCPSLRIDNGDMVVGLNNSASSSDKDLSWAHNNSPIDWKLAMSWQSTPNHCSSGPSLSHQLIHGAFSKVGQQDSQLKQPTLLSHLLSVSKCKDGSEFSRGTITSPGLVGLESPFMYGRPSYLHNTCTSSSELITYCSNTTTHTRDEIAPISTGLLYGNISEPVTSRDHEVFQQNRSSIEFGKINLTHWHLPLLENRQRTPKTDFPNGMFLENVSIDLHRTCSVEGKKAQGLRLSQGSTELVSSSNAIFGLSLAPVFSPIQPNPHTTEFPIEMKTSSEILMQNLKSSSFSGMNAPFLPSIKPSDNLLYSSGPPTSNIGVSKSDQGPSIDSSFQPKGGQQSPLRNVLNSAKDHPSLISDLNLSLLVHGEAPPCSSSAPLHSFPLSSEIFISANNLSVTTGGMGLELLGLSNTSPNFGAPSIDSDDHDVPPFISVVMDGRSIGGRVCLQKLDGYESFALTIWNMFKDNIAEDSMAASGEGCNLSNAIPGFVIAYEDAEGDLLLVGDLSWRDFVRVAKCIKVVPAKKNKMKGSS